MVRIHPRPPNRPLARFEQNRYDQNIIFIVVTAMRILGGLILCIVGALITIYAEQVYQAFGSFAFAEKYLGSEGGTRLFYKLFGIVVFIVGALTMTGMFGPLLVSLLGGIFDGAQ